MAEPNSRRRWPLLLLTLVAAAGVIAAALFGPGARKTGGLDPEAPQAETVVETKKAAESPSEPAVPAAPQAAPTAPAAPIAGMRARLPQGTSAGASPASIGSLQPDKAGFVVEFAPGSAGIQRIVFSS